jgi:glycolate dehydrogenase FAD-binding subunit
MSTTVALTQEECKARLEAIAGTEHTSILGETVTVAASDAEQIAEILRFADDNGIAVTPHGRGSKQSWGNPVESGIRLDLGRMNKLREHAWQDMTCTVEAGCTWAAMQAELAQHGQMVALDPLWPERATVGGVVATNDGGSLRLKYGGLRDLIIGMTVVLADGTIAKTGGKVVKNVAGYDLHKLMTGSYGTLGVIIEVNFRLHPLETNVQTWTAFATRPQQFEKPLRNLLDSQLTPSSVQLRLSDAECELDVKVAAPAECMDEHESKLRNIFGEMELKPADDAVWYQRELLHNSPEVAVLKISALPSDLCRLASELRSWAAKNSCDLALAAQANGLITVAFRSEPDHAIALIKQLRSRFRSTGGSVVVLQASSLPQAALDPWGRESDALPLMKEIKRRFDPNRILNPGRFVGNI